MSLGIQAIGTALGRESIDNIAQGQSFGKDADFIRHKIGFSTLRRMAADQTPVSLCVDAFHDLQTRTVLDPAACDCLMLVSQTGLQGRALPHLSALVHGALGLQSHVAALDIGLGCSGYVYALHLMTAFMQSNGLRQGLLFTADPYSQVLDPADANTCLLFGDAATCTLISETPVYLPGKARFATDGAHAAALAIKEDGLLFMQGRPIFNFSMLTVPPQIHQCLADNGLSPDDLDMALLHQASRYIVEAMAPRLGLPPEKVPFALDQVGNCVSSTLPLALSSLAFTPGQMPRRILLCGFGVGLSWASTVLHHHEV